MDIQAWQEVVDVSNYTVQCETMVQSYAACLMDIVCPSAFCLHAPCAPADDLNMQLVLHNVVCVSDIQVLSLDGIDDVRPPRLLFFPHHDWVFGLLEALRDSWTCT